MQQIPDQARLDTEFDGAKVAVLQNGQLLTKLRDDKADIPFPNAWDFPGGGKDAKETPIQTAVRECYEEFHVTLTEEDFVWGRKYPAVLLKNAFIWFFVAKLPSDRVLDVKLGDEGQEWRWMSFDTYKSQSNCIPHFVRQYEDFLDVRR